MPEPLSPKSGFGMNVTRLAGRAGDVLDHVLVGHDLIGHAGQRLVAEVDLALAAGRDLVVVELARDAEPLERQHHRRAQVVQRVVRRRREVALLLADRVPEARLARVPVALGGVERVVRVVRAEVVGDLVEDEELALGPEVGRVGDPGLGEVRLGASSDSTRVALVPLARDRVGDLADERERRRLGERVEDRAGRVRHQQHVRLRDPLPAADRGAVEAEALVEGRLVERAQRQRHVLPATEQVAELQVDELRLRSRPAHSSASRRGGNFLAPVRDVVLRLRLGHRRLLPVGPTKKAPGLTRVPRPHCLGARLRRRAPGPTIGTSAGRTQWRCRAAPPTGRYPERRDVAPRLIPVSARAA